MKIDHVAIWCLDLEKMRYFYEYFFDTKCDEKYEDKNVGFASYFLTLPDGIRIELMAMDTVELPISDVYTQFIGLAHLAFSLGSETKVDDLTKKLVSDGYELLDGPCRTDNDYYVSVVLDPEGNRLELMV
ncbi:VOC family protein [Vibrio sp. F74]|uniref:VOC family protein n=1 Tax=Vibrio sp. F74 TaxID=700020 RepID=UPI0035F5BE21